MDTIASAREGYAHAARQIRSPRGTEYDAFARVTAGLRTAAQAGAGLPLLAAAVHDNRRLWTILAADVAEPGNGLPAPLRARIFALAEFALRHSSRVLAGDASAEVLIDINTAVMDGLRGGGAPR